MKYIILLSVFISCNTGTYKDLKCCQKLLIVDFPSGDSNYVIGNESEVYWEINSLLSNSYYGDMATNPRPNKIEKLVVCNCKDSSNLILGFIDNQSNLMSRKFQPLKFNLALSDLDSLRHDQYSISFKQKKDAINFIKSCPPTIHLIKGSRVQNYIWYNYDAGFKLTCPSAFFANEEPTTSKNQIENLIGSGSYEFRETTTIYVEDSCYDTFYANRFVFEGKSSYKNGDVFQISPLEFPFEVKVLTKKNLTKDFLDEFDAIIYN